MYLRQETNQLSVAGRAALRGIAVWIGRGIGRAPIATAAWPAATKADSAALRLLYVSVHVLGRPGFNTGFLQKSEVAKPVDEPVLPGPVRDAVPVRQTAAHAVAGMAAVAVNVHFNVGHASPQHSAKIIVRPHGMYGIA